MTVKAKVPFYHTTLGLVRRGQVLEVSEKLAKDLTGKVQTERKRKNERHDKKSDSGKS